MHYKAYSSGGRPHPSDARDSALVFPRTGQPQGFATLATTQWDGNPEHVVRELLQNSLDACVEVGREPCEVSFTIREVALGSIPGIDQYREHFRAANAERKESPQGPAEVEIICRIASVLARDRVQVLLCRDNGLGLNTNSMSRLLTEGNTDKAEAGAGAFGVGHLTAFAASDLRYVLYAGRSGAANGGCRDVVSGHAMLASRTERGPGGRVKAAFGANGFWMARNAAEGGSDQLGLFEPRYPETVPEPLRSSLGELPDTGSVVCIAGFNRFRDDEDPGDAILRVAAKNFLVAIQCRRMIVEVRDETRPGPRRIVDDNGLRGLLRATKSQRRTRSGWLPGEQAYRCLRTLQEGDQINLACGAVARVRRLDPSEGTASRVQLFRSGMWITNRADELTLAHFAGYIPFDAAVMIDEGEIEKLVRGAEGPEHRGLDRRRLGSRESKKRLLQLLREIKEELQGHVGEIEQSKEYAPDDFAIFGKRGQQLAEKVAPYRLRTPPAVGVDEASADATVTKPSKDDDADSIDPGGNGKGGSGGGAKPKPGKAVAGQASVRAVRNSHGEVEALRVYWKPENTVRRGSLGVRVRIPSGSDETCELPLGPKWLRIREIQTEGGEPKPPANHYEAPLPPGEVSFTLRLASPLAEAQVMEVDVVRRAAPGTEVS